MKVAIIQARTGSSRLPGKILKPLGGKTVIQNLYERIQQCQQLDKVVIAMPEGEKDDALAAHVAEFCTLTHRGSESDVLDRYLGAAEKHEATTIIRITSDCPFFDPSILDKMLISFEDCKPDYMTNTLEPNLPRGLDAEVFTIQALRRAHTEGKAQHEREHVTPYIYQHPDLFNLASYTTGGDWSHLRWTLDTTQDWELIEKMYNLLPVPYLDARLEDFLALQDRYPELRKINASIEQKPLEGA